LVLLLLLLSGCKLDFGDGTCNGQPNPAGYWTCTDADRRITFGARCICTQNRWECTCPNDWCAIYFGFGGTCDDQSGGCCPVIDMGVSKDLQLGIDMTVDVGTADLLLPLDGGAGD